MKRTLIAFAAVALPTLPALAQGNVTIYGVADLTLENVSANGATTGTPANQRPSRMRVTSNSSYLGFRGSEDLANGLKAIFQFESSINADGSASTLFGSARDSFVGLDDKALGMLKLGINTTPYRRIGGQFDFNPGKTGASYNNALFGELRGRRTGFRDRLANSVIYNAPKFAGFGASFVYGANEGRDRATGRNDHTYGIGLDYGAGPLYVAYAFERRNDLSSTFLGLTATTDNKVTGHLIGAKYRFTDSTTLGAMFDRAKAETAAATAKELQRDAWGVQLEHVMGQNQFVLQYTSARKAELNGVDIPGSDAAMWSLAWNYNLSKRTMIKTYYAQIRNKAAANYDFYLQPIDNSTTGTLPLGADPRAVGIGVRHTF